MVCFANVTVWKLIHFSKDVWFVSQSSFTNDLFSCPFFLRHSCRKVYLGCKKTNPEQLYAIKVMKKSEMIHKNMASQGTFSCFMNKLWNMYFNRDSITICISLSAISCDWTKCISTIKKSILCTTLLFSSDNLKYFFGMFCREPLPSVAVFLLLKFVPTLHLFFLITGNGIHGWWWPKISP